MTVVLDTNVVLSARAARHPHYVIVLAIAAGVFRVAVSTEILLEYEEIITANAGAGRWRQFASVLEVGLDSLSSRACEGSLAISGGHPRVWFKLGPR